MKTLLIDDHALLRETLAAVMAQTWPAFDVLQAGNLADACTLCDGHPDLGLLLIDLGLPDAVGISSQTTLRARTAGPPGGGVGRRPAADRAGRHRGRRGGFHPQNQRVRGEPSLRLTALVAATSDSLVC